MVLTFLLNNQARIVETLYQRIYQTTQAEAHFVPDALRDNIAEVLPHSWPPYRPTTLQPSTISWLT